MEYIPNIKNISHTDLIKKILKGDIVSLSRAITLVESKKRSDREIANKILKECLLRKNSSIRIGVTGVPGVGKSTFIESFGSYLSKTGKKIAVLAVDPSSSLTKGSILGDKTRMENLVRDKNVYIIVIYIQSSIRIDQNNDYYKKPVQIQKSTSRWPKSGNE